MARTYHHHDKPDYLSDNSIGRYNVFRKIARKVDTMRLRRKCTCLAERFRAEYAKDVRADDLSREDFEYLGSLGEGGSGTVNLVRKKDTMRLTALKMVKKSVIEDIRDFEGVITEKRVMRAVLHPFVARMLSHFQDETTLYMELEHYPGGDLHSFLHRFGRCSSELARFYASQLVMAVDFLHRVGIVHRDLKPENVMIGADGYLCLVDLGLAKKLDDGRTRSMCGTPDFVAPEMLLVKAKVLPSYGVSVDWWAFGAIVFAMVSGNDPFTNGIESFKDIINGNVNYPAKMKPFDKVFLTGLLEKEVSLRLGCGENGGEEIMDHSWFQRLNWAAVFFKRIKAPYIPQCTGVGSASPLKTPPRENKKHGAFDFSGF